MGGFAGDGGGFIGMDEDVKECSKMLFPIDSLFCIIKM